MKKQELYRILIDGKEVYTALTQMEYMNRMEDVAVEFYQTGSPDSSRIKTEIYTED